MKGGFFALALLAMFLVCSPTVAQAADVQSVASKYNPFKNTIDNIFSFPIQLLDQAKTKVKSGSNLAGQGVDVSKWLAPLSVLGKDWIKVVNSIFAGSTIVLGVWIARKLYDIYLQVKEGVRWW